MELQPFVTEVIESIGGIVTPVEYALCEALVPAEYAHLFAGRDALVLAFDSEVAQENPGSEFIAFGSGALAELIGVVRAQPLCTMRFAYADTLSAMGDEKFAAWVDSGGAQVKIRAQTRCLSLWARIAFRAVFLSDERSESAFDVWIDLRTGRIDEDVRESAVFYQTRPIEVLPYADAVPIADALETARGFAMARAQSQLPRLVDPAFVERELTTIHEYYADLRQENQKRKNRKGTTPEQLEDIEARHRAILAEEEQKVQQTREKFEVHIDLAPENIVLYHIPLMRIEADFISRAGVEEKTFYYDSIHKRLLS